MTGAFLDVADNLAVEAFERVDHQVDLEAFVAVAYFLDILAAVDHPDSNHN